MKMVCEVSILTDNAVAIETNILLKIFNFGLGVIVNTSAFAAYDGTRGQAGYAASNAGIIGMTLPIARDFAEQGIRVVTLVPGLFQTKMCLGDIPQDCQTFLAETCLAPGRLGDPAEYADFVESVVSNPLLNGVAIRIDSGFRSFLFN